jgi:hypothetical protein
MKSILSKFNHDFSSHLDQKRIYERRVHSGGFSVLPHETIARAFQEYILNGASISFDNTMLMPLFKN